MRIARIFLILIATLSLAACPVLTSCSGEDIPAEQGKEEPKEPEGPEDPEDDQDDQEDSEGQDDPKIDQALADALQETVQSNILVIQKLLSVDCLSTCTTDISNGQATIGFTDGTDVTIKIGSDGHQMLTVAANDNGYFWALIRNGNIEIIRVGNDDLPVSSTPRFRLTEKGEWEMAVNENDNWQSTGLSVDIASTTYVIDFFKGVTVSDGIAQITLSGDTTITLPVVGDGSITIDQSSVWYTRLNEKKEFMLTTYNVKSMTITGTPDEWQAEISGNTLSVTSPSVVTDVNKGGNVEITAEFDGNGKTAVVSIEVQYDKELTLSADAYGLVKAVISEHVPEGYLGYILKAWPLADFTNDAVISWLNGEGRNTTPQTQSREYNISEICDNFTSGTAYKIFAISAISPDKVASGAELYTADNLQTAEYAPVSVAIEVSNIRYDGATLNVQYNDMPQYYAGISTATDWNNYVRKNFLEMLGWGGMAPLTASSYNGDASKFPSEENETKIIPSTEYIVWVISATDEDGYTEDDFITKSFTTPGIEPGAGLELPAYNVTELTYGGFTAEVTPPAGAYKTYAAILPIQSIPGTDEETVSLLINTDKSSKGDSKLTVSSNNYSADDEVYLLAVSLNEDGKYGKILKERVELKKLTYTRDIGIQSCNLEYGLGDVTMTLTFIGNPETITYFAASYTYYTDAMLQKMMAMGQYGDVIDQKISSLTNGNQIHFTGLELGTQYIFYAIVKDKDNNPSYMYTKAFVPSVGISYVMKNNPDYNYGMPQISGTWQDNSTYVMNVDMPEQCTKFWIQVCDSEYLTGDVYTDTDRILTLTGYGSEAHTESIKGKVYSYLNNSTRVYIAWLDDQGRYHAIYEYNPKQ